MGGSTSLWCRQILVKEKGWLDDDVFGQAQAIAQVFPGPNALNLAAYVGFHFYGVLGALMCLLGLTLIPFCLVMGLGSLYLHNGARPAVSALFTGLGAGAAGASAGNALDFSKKYRRDPWFWSLAVGVYLALVVARLHILIVVGATVAVALVAFRPKGRE